MIVLSAEMQAKPGSEAECEQVLRALIAPVSKEEGAIDYRLHRAPDIPGRFFFYEKYRDQAAFDLHMGTSYLKDTLTRIEPLLAEKPRLVVYEELDSVVPKVSGDRFFVIESTFSKPFETFGDTVLRHRQGLQAWYDKGVLLCSGPKADRSGGIMVACAEDATVIDTLLAADPYVKEGLAQYSYKEFATTKKSKRLV